MVSKALFVSTTLVLISYLIIASGSSFSNHNAFNLNSNGSYLAGIEMPDQSFNANALASSTTGCSLSTSKSDVNNLEKLAKDHSVKLSLRHRKSEHKEKKHSVIEYTLRDLDRIHTFRRRIKENKNQNAVSRRQKHRHLLEDQHASGVDEGELSGNLVGSLKSGVSLGSGEYFMDVFVGTPPKQFSLILDTGSDLNWIQCTPCHDCFEQNGPYYDPKASSSYKDISCKDPRCDLVSSPDPPISCKSPNQSCPYFYWYGDSSNTTGDFALETFTVNLTTHGAGKSVYKKAENVMFGCGHWNRGLFHGAAGLLGLGRGPLSFSSQLQSLYGHSFSYCLVDRDSDASVSSKLILGEDKSLLNHPELKFTNLINGKDNPADTFYYIGVKSIVVGGERLKIPEDTWNFTEDGGGGTIIDSGTTLSYFQEPAYEVIKEAFTKRIKHYPVVSDFPLLGPCYNVSGVESLNMPSFKILFTDGAEWNFPIQNYFIWIEQEVVCLAILGTKKSAFSIIGNYQQQNFHILYDTKKSRLGFAPTRCADV